MEVVESSKALVDVEREDHGLALRERALHLVHQRAAGVQGGEARELPVGRVRGLVCVGLGGVVEVALPVVGPGVQALAGQDVEVLTGVAALVVALGDLRVGVHRRVRGTGDALLALHDGDRRPVDGPRHAGPDLALIPHRGKVVAEVHARGDVGGPEGVRGDGGVGVQPLRGRQRAERVVVVVAVRRRRGGRGGGGGERGAHRAGYRQDGDGAAVGVPVHGGLPSVVGAGARDGRGGGRRACAGMCCRGRGQVRDCHRDLTDHRVNCQEPASLLPVVNQT